MRIALLIAAAVSLAAGCKGSAESQSPAEFASSVQEIAEVYNDATLHLNQIAANSDASDFLYRDASDSDRYEDMVHRFGESAKRAHQLATQLKSTRGGDEVRLSLRAATFHLNELAIALQADEVSSARIATELEATNAANMTFRVTMVAFCEAEGDCVWDPSVTLAQVEVGEPWRDEVGGWLVTVEEASTTDAINHGSGVVDSPRGIYVVIALTFENFSQSAKPPPFDDVGLMDSSGRTYSASNSYEADETRFYPNRPLAFQRVVVNPGLSVTVVTVFDVPADLTGLQVRLPGGSTASIGDLEGGRLLQQAASSR